MTYIYSAFLLFSFISISNSGDLGRSIASLLYYIAIGLWGLYAFNHQEEIQKRFTTFIYVFSGIYILVWIGLTLFASFIPDPLFVKTGYQFVFSKFTSHNHLGDFLMLPLIGCLYYLINHQSKKIVAIVLLLLAIFLFAYSRSAYISLILVSISMFFVLGKKSYKHTSFYKILLVFLVGACSLFFIATVREAQAIPVVNKLHQFLSEDFSLKEKFFLSRRVDVIDQIGSKKPGDYLFGVGLGNFQSISKEYAQSRQSFSESTHNIFLDFFVENGVFAMLIFVVFLYNIFLHADKKSLYFFFVLAMLLNFQTDYTFRIYSFFLLFFILLGLISQKEKLQKANPWILCILSGVIFFAVVRTYASLGFLYTKQYQIAWILNPFQKAVYIPLIEEQKKKNNPDEQKRLLLLYERFFSTDAVVLADIGEFYKRSRDKKKAISYFQKSFRLDRFRDHNLLNEIYSYMLSEYGQEIADGYYKAIVVKYFPPSVKKKLPYVYRRNLDMLCGRMEGKNICDDEK